MIVLLKTFIAGLILGLLGAGAVVIFVPAVDLHRERSLIEVQANGGNLEEFRINLPRDRIMVGLAGSPDSIPAGLDWPDRSLLGEMQTELFKVRNRDNVVVGVASRLAGSSDENGAFIEWALHFPARGTVYAAMEMTPTADGYRNGVVRAGTREFAELSGEITEQFVAAEQISDDSQGRIEIIAALVAPLGDVE